MLTHREFIETLADLMSREPEKVREANRRLYEATVDGKGPHPSGKLSADLALAEAASK